MSGMLCIGGGVLLATVFIHMIPEVREQLELAKKQGKKGVLPQKNTKSKGVCPLPVTFLTYLP